MIRRRIRLQDDLEATKKALASRRKALRPIVLRQLQEHGVSEQVARGGATEQELAVLTELESRLNAEIKSVSEVNRSMTVNTLDLQAIQDEVAQMQDVADKAGAEVEALNVELEAPPRIRLIEEATVPQTRDEKKRYMMIGMITAGSFFAQHFRDRLPGIAEPKGRYGRRGPRRAGVDGRWRLADPAIACPRQGDDGAPADREAPLLAKHLARIGRRDPDHAGARRPHRVAPRGDDRQRRRRRGQDLAVQLPGNQPRAKRYEDPADRRRSSQPLDPPRL